MTGTVVVLGSLNVDEVAGVEVLPRPGETVMATSHAIHPGGKGANQAVAAARAGAPVRMVGTVGDDAGATLLRDSLAAEGIEPALRTATATTGRALILVQDDGENAITVVPGANHSTTADDVDRACAALTPDDVLVLQLEIPHDLVARAAGRGRDAGALVVLNAAPAVDSFPLEHVDVLVVNEHECLRLDGRPPEDDALAAAASLAGRHGLAVVVTLGAAGAAHTRGDVPGVVPSPAVDTVDTTGAGDTFVGYLAASLLDGADLPAAIDVAVRAGALAVTRRGAQPAIPRVGELTGGAG